MEQQRQARLGRGQSGSLFPDEGTDNKKEWHGATGGGQQWSIYQGAADQVLRRLPADSIDCVVTSPPYYWLRDYGVSGQIGHEESVAGYVGALASVMDEVHRVLRKDGLLFL